MTGEYHKIDLFRGKHPDFEMTVIGVGLSGQVVSYDYHTHGQIFSIRQFIGLDAEALARQMTEQSDPVWER